MNVADFDFDLPAHLIAQTPSPQRGESRLLVLERDSSTLTHSTIRDLPAWLRRGDLLVVNNTRVFPARLVGRRVPSGGVVEWLLLRPQEIPCPASGQALRSGSGQVQHWEALVHPGQKLKPGARVRFGDPPALTGEVLARRFYGRRIVKLWSEEGRDVLEVINQIGHVPLPPYIKRPDDATDRERYQTVFAREPGSVAAPTAGLHFIDSLLETLRSAGVDRAEITLHVGYGTFKPVRSDRVEDHRVDPEPFTIDAAAAGLISRTLEAGRRVVAVGTTTTRALETAARRAQGAIQASTGMADLFIYPGFQFRVTGALLTNFHLPRSSLLMLVCAFGGRSRVLAAYREAVAKEYRFYSYGDAMLIV